MVDEPTTYETESMIDTETKIALNQTGKRLSLILPGFYGKISFNFQNGVYVNSNVEQSIRANNLKKGVKHEDND